MIRASAIDQTQTGFKTYPSIANKGRLATGERMTARMLLQLSGGKDTMQTQASPCSQVAESAAETKKCTKILEGLKKKSTRQLSQSRFFFVRFSLCS